MRRILTITFLAVFIFALSRELLTPKQFEQLRLGYSQEAPYAYVDEHKKLTGIFVTAAEHVTAKMDIKQVDWLLHDFFQLFGSLQQRRIDVIAAGLTITPERAKSLCFTEPLLQANSALLILAKSDFATNSFDDENKIAVIANSIEHKTLVHDSYSLLLVASADEGAFAVLQHKAAALALTEPTLLQLQQRFKGQFKLVKHNGIADLEHFSAFAVHPENAALVKQWNKSQRQLQQQPAFNAAAEQLGFKIPALPDAITGHCYAV